MEPITFDTFIHRAVAYDTDSKITLMIDNDVISDEVWAKIAVLAKRKELVSVQISIDTPELAQIATEGNESEELDKQESGDLTASEGGINLYLRFHKMFFIDNRRFYQFMEESLGAQLDGDTCTPEEAKQAFRECCGVTSTKEIAIEELKEIEADFVKWIANRQDSLKQKG